MRRVVPYLAVVAVVAGLLWAFGGDEPPAPKAAVEAPPPRARKARRPRRADPPPPRPAPEAPNPDTTDEPRRVVDDEGWDPGATNAPPPVTLYPPNPSGITAALDAVAPDLQDCWSNIKERDPSLPPVLQVKFTLVPPPDPSAERALVDEIGLAEGAPADPELLACVQNHLSNLAVAAPVGDPVQMSFPFAFGDPDAYQPPVDAGQ